MRKPSVKIKIDNKLFIGIGNAAKYLGVKYQTIADAFKLGRKEINGHSIERLDTPLKRAKSKIKIKMKHSCPVLCTTTGKKYDSISDAARALNLDSWTIGLKMAKAGKFIDNNGNVYIREKPANYKREYPKQQPIMLQEKKAFAKRSRPSIKKAVEKISKIKSPEKINVSNTFLSNSEEETLQNVISGMIKAKQYNEASVLLKVLAKNS